MPVATDPAAPPRPAYRAGFGTAPGASSVAAWRCAGRLAWREVRRRPGRTALVVLLVLLPTLAMTLGVVLARTEARWSADSFTRDAGRVADLEVRAAVAPTDDRLDEALPAESRWVRYREVFGTVRSAGSDGVAVGAAVTDLPMGDPVTGDLLRLRSGALPDPGEVVVTERLAGKLGVAVGDTLRLDRPSGSWRVSGLAVSLGGFDDHRLVIPAFDWALARSDLVGEVVLVDLPGEPDVATSDALLAELGGGAARARQEEAELSGSGELRTEALAWGWVTGVLGLVVVGIVIAAAFATSARRQLVTLGQLAAQGAPRRVVRRTLALQGWWTGLLGATAGVALGLAALTLARGRVELLWSRAVDGYVIRPTDFVAIVLTGAVAGTVAALVPARSAARVPVLTALSGRRPVGRVPRLLVPVGLVLFGGGTGLIALAVAVSRSPNGDSAGADGSLVALVAILGGLGILFGACCASPLVVDLAARAVTRLGGTPRLAARSLARSRGRSAGVVTAIAVVGAVAVLVSTFMATGVARSSSNDQDDAPYLPRNAVHVTTMVPGQDEFDLEDGVSAELRAELEEVLPGSRFVAHRKAIPDGILGAEVPSPATPSPPLPPVGSSDPLRDAWWSAPTVADDGVLDLVGLSASDRTRLERTGILVLRGVVGPTDLQGNPLPVPETMDVSFGSPVITTTAAVNQDPIGSYGGGLDILVTEEALSRWGLRASTFGAYVLAPTDLTERQMGQLDDLRSATQDTTFLPPQGTTTPEWAVNVMIDWQWPEGNEVPVTLLYAVVVGVALLLTLLVVAIGLSLSATESRDERDVLVAVGARPRTLRRMAGVKAVFLAGTGVVLAVPTGLVPALVVLREPGRPEALPWVALALLLVAVPLVAGLLAWVSSSIAQRVRPVHASSFAVD